MSLLRTLKSELIRKKFKNPIETKARAILGRNEN
jgi:hypothetical protein